MVYGNEIRLPVDLMYHAAMPKCSCNSFGTCPTAFVDLLHKAVQTAHEWPVDSCRRPLKGSALVITLVCILKPLCEGSRCGSSIHRLPSNIMYLLMYCSYIFRFVDMNSGEFLELTQVVTDSDFMQVMEESDVTCVGQASCPATPTEASSKEGLTHLFTR